MSKIEECDYLLDSIINLIHKVPDEDPSKAALLEKYNILRHRFENYTNDEFLIYILVKYLSSLDMYVHGNLEEAPTEALPDPEQLKGYEHVPVLRRSNINQYIDILSNSLDEVINTNDYSRLQKLTNHVQDEYEKISMKRQALDQKISEAWFKLMIFYLLNNQIESADKLCKDFGLDMRIYLIDYFRDVLLSSKVSGNTNNAEFAWKYLYGKEPLRESDLKLWEAIVNIEYPEMHFKIPDEYLNKETTVKEKKRPNRLLKFFKKEKEQQPTTIKDQKESVTINYSAPDDKFLCRIRASGCLPDTVDLLVLQNVCKMKNANKKDVVAVFEFGIEKIRLTNSYTSNTKVQDFSKLVDVVIPPTAKIIEKNCFYNINNIKRLDLSKTNIVKIKMTAFLGSKIEEISFPQTLEQLEYGCFLGTKHLTKIDLSKTYITTIPQFAFYDSAITDFKAPEDLRVVGSAAFANTMNLKELDLGNCKNLYYISPDAFKNSAIEKLILPKKDLYSSFLRYHPNITVIYKN